MANYERGAYEPSDEVRVYDGADDEDDEEGSRLPILIVMALLVLAAFGGVVWLAYERGVASGRTEPRIITAVKRMVLVHEDELHLPLGILRAESSCGIPRAIDL